MWEAFSPHPLPPEPRLTRGGCLKKASARAAIAFGKLDNVTNVLPDPGLFLHSFIRKEPLVFSQIEGTRSTLDDLLQFEATDLPGAPTDDGRRCQTTLPH